MTSVAAALLSSLAWGVADFAGGTASRGRHVLAVLAITRPAGLLVVAPLALVLPSAGLGGAWPYAVGAGCVLPLAILCLYRALAIGPMPLVAPIFTLAAAVPVLVGVLDGETPGPLVAVGLAVALGGAVLAARAPSPDGPGVDAPEPDRAATTTEDGRGTPSPDASTGLRYAAACAALIGVGLVLVDRAAAADPVRAVLLARATETVVVAVAAALLWPRVAGQLRPIGRIPLIGVFEGAAILAYAVATTGGLLPVVAVLSSLYPVVTMLLAWRLLHERTAGLQLAGAALTLVGVGVVAAAGAG